MSHLLRMLEDYAPNAEVMPKLHPETAVRAAREAVRKGDDLAVTIRGVPIGAVANVAVELDALADLLRTAASNLRNAAAAELRRADSQSLQANR